MKTSEKQLQHLNALVTLPSAYDLYEPILSLRKAFGDDLDDLDALKLDDPDLYENYMTKLKVSQSNPMSDAAKRGREIFFSTKGRCSACHVGAIWQMRNTTTWVLGWIGHA